MLDLHLSSGFFELFVEEGVILASLLSQLLKFSFAFFQIGVDFGLMMEIESDGPVHLLWRQSRKAVSNAFGRFSTPIGLNDRV